MSQSCFLELCYYANWGIQALRVFVIIIIMQFWTSAFLRNDLVLCELSEMTHVIILSNIYTGIRWPCLFLTFFPIWPIALQMQDQCHRVVSTRTWHYPLTFTSSFDINGILDISLKPAVFFGDNCDFFKSTLWLMIDWGWLC